MDMLRRLISCRIIIIIIIIIIRDLHTGTTARVRTSQGMSDVFYTTSKVRQGIGSCDTVLVVLESMLATYISPTSTTLMTRVLFTDVPTKRDYVFRNFEASAGVMGLHTKLA